MTVSHLKPEKAVMFRRKTAYYGIANSWSHVLDNVSLSFALSILEVGLLKVNRYFFLKITSWHAVAIQYQISSEIQYTTLFTPKTWC